MTRHEIYIRETEIIDHTHPLIQELLEKTIQVSDDEKTKAIKIYYAVRDGWKYYPYNILFTKKGLQASEIIQREVGHCIDKAILMLALCRASGIACRLGLAKVTNHVSTERLEAVLKTNELVPHGYVELFLNEKWVKATPAFNQSLCEKLNVAALDFNGEQDSLLQEYNDEGGIFMEYIEDYGQFEDVPLDFMIELARKHYPHVFDSKDTNGIVNIEIPKNRSID